MLVDLYDRGMREPAPLYCLTSAAYAAAARTGGDPVAAARAEWEGSHARPGEAEDADHQLVLGALDFDDLLVPRPAARRAGTVVGPRRAAPASAAGRAACGTGCSRASR